MRPMQAETCTYNCPLISRLSFSLIACELWRILGFWDYLPTSYTSDLNCYMVIVAHSRKVEVMLINQEFLWYVFWYTCIYLVYLCAGLCVIINCVPNFSCASQPNMHLCARAMPFLLSMTYQMCCLFLLSNPTLAAPVKHPDQRHSTRHHHAFILHCQGLLVSYPSQANTDWFEENQCSHACTCVCIPQCAIQIKWFIFYGDM